MPACKHMPYPVLLALPEWALIKKLSGALQRKAIRKKEHDSIMRTKDAHSRRLAMVKIVFETQQYKSVRAASAAMARSKPQAYMRQAIREVKITADRRHRYYMQRMKFDQKKRKEDEERLLYRLGAVIECNLSRMCMKHGIKFKPRVPMRPMRRITKTMKTRSMFGRVQLSMPA